MNQLSPKQARIYEFILSFTQENGYPPLGAGDRRGGGTEKSFHRPFSI